MRRAESSTVWWPESGWVMSVDLRALGTLHEAVDLLVGEAGEAARVLGDGNGDDIVRAVLAGAAEVEALVDGFLELDGSAAALRVAARELVQTARAHPHVRDLIREHVVHGALDDGIADLGRDVDELVEDIARQALEAPVHTRHARGSILRACAPPENGGLGKLAEAAPEVLEQTQVRFHVTRLVPHLPRHVHG